MKIWRQFKAFALAGSMMDLAIAVIIGAAFGKVIDSVTANIFEPLIAAIGGNKGTDAISAVAVTVHGTPVKYGAFLGDLINFLLYALVLFLLVKLLAVIGASRQRSFEERQCPWCMEWISPDAVVCKVCRQPLVDKLPSLRDAESRAAKLRQHHHLKVDIPGIDVKEMLTDVADVLDGPDKSPARKRTTARKTVPAPAVSAEVVAPAAMIVEETSYPDATGSSYAGS